MNVGLTASAPRVSPLLQSSDDEHRADTTTERATHFGLAHNSRVSVVALLGASLHGVSGVANRFCGERATFKPVQLSDVMLSVQRLNASLAHVRVDLALTEHALVVLSLSGAMSTDAELFASLAALRTHSAAATVEASSSSASDALSSSATNVGVGVMSSSISDPLSADCDRWLEAKEREHTRAVLYLFHVAHVVALCHDGPSLDVVSLRHLASVASLKRSLSASLGAFLAQHEADFSIGSSLNRSTDSRSLVQKEVMPGHITPVFCAVFALAHDDIDSAANLKTLRNALTTQLHGLVRSLGLDSEPQRLLQLGKQSALLAKADAAFAVCDDRSDPLSAASLLRGDLSLVDDESQAVNSWDSDVLSARVVNKMISDAQERTRKSAKQPKARSNKPLEDAEAPTVLPMCRRWFNAATLLQNFFFGPAALATADADARPERSLSQAICSDAMRAALERFNSTSVSLSHEERLRSAMLVYDRLAIGSSRSTFADKLRAECTRFSPTAAQQQPQQPLHQR
jgi:hypothetical protein